MKSKTERHKELGEFIISLDIIAIVSYIPCLNAGVVCYYAREASVSYTECLLKHRNCDSTFSLEELRKVGA